MKFTLLLFLLLFASAIAAFVPPAPGVENVPDFVYQSNDNNAHVIYSKESTRGLMNAKDTPDSVLVLMIEFRDVKFRSEEAHPDYLIHNNIYFERYMSHLADYYYDASRGIYDLRNKDDFPAHTTTYYVFPEVITLSEDMGYYGDDDLWAERTAIFVKETIELFDNSIDFSKFDSFIFFHAGAGQESDTDDTQAAELWSTFISISDLREGLDPDNESYQGIPTNDGTFVREIVICPENEWQPYYTEDDSILDILGVIAHQFGHRLGLPTLFDNVISDGRSSGIGNWGIMGTGSWNANGYVPPFPCAWSRYFMGWENATLTDKDSKDELQLLHTLSDDTSNPKLYKFPISATEYFLIENRQQNPDNSLQTWYKEENGSVVVDKVQESFTFQLVENQDYYPYPNEHIARFNFMKNHYRTCEWDFYTPGLGGPLVNNQIVDGSGLLIWHVDEYVIESSFDQNFENNHPNGNALHKGVDLEEADMVQHMDAQNHEYYRGSPFDSYRADNNSYFGSSINNYLVPPSTSYPTADSYYGGINLEFYNIGNSQNIMTFSVNDLSALIGGVEGTNLQPISIIDLNNDGQEEIVYPMSDGSIVVWDSLMIETYTPSSEYNFQKNIFYSFDETENSLYLPGIVSNSTNSRSVIYKAHYDSGYEFTSTYFDLGLTWANTPVLIKHGNDSFHILAFNNLSDYNSRIMFTNPEITVQDTLAYENNLIKGNFVYDDELIYFCTAEDSNYTVRSIDPVSKTELSIIANFSLPSEDDILYLVGYPFVSQSGTTMQKSNVISIITKMGNVLSFYTTGAEVEGFPIILTFDNPSIPTISDVDSNGDPEILINGPNSFSVIEQNGNKYSINIDQADSTTTENGYGILSLNLNNDKQKEYFGAFSYNRIFMFDSHNEIVNGYPVSFADKGHFLPVFLNIYNDNRVYSLFASDNGIISKKLLSDSDINQVRENLWYTELGNYKRTAFFSGETSENTYQTTKTFVKDKVYVFPNPINWISGFDLKFNVMVSKGSEVELTIYDIAANEIYQKKAYFEAYQNSDAKFKLNTDKLSSGVYFAIFKADGEVIKRKFAVEK